MQFLTEYTILISALAFFAMSLGKFSPSTLRQAALAAAVAAVAAAAASQDYTGV